MSTRYAILTVLVLLWVSSGAATAQDIPERKNAVSLALLPLASRTFSLSYARKLKNGFELTLNPRVQLSSPNAPTSPGTDQGAVQFGFFRILNNDPQSWYNHYMLRSGLRIPLTPRFGYEPQLQLGGGSFFNKVLITDDSEGSAYDRYQRLDRKYYSAGIVNMVNWLFDYNRLRVKLFLGLGTHLRRYEETQYQRYAGYQELSYNGPTESSYYKAQFGFHDGVEIGVRF